MNKDNLTLEDEPIPRPGRRWRGRVRGLLRSPFYPRRNAARKLVGCWIAGGIVYLVTFAILVSTHFISVVEPVPVPALVVMGVATVIALLDVRRIWRIATGAQPSGREERWNGD